MAPRPSLGNVEADAVSEQLLSARGVATEGLFRTVYRDVYAARSASMGATRAHKYALARARAKAEAFVASTDSDASIVTTQPHHRNMIPAEAENAAAQLLAAHGSATESLFRGVYRDVFAMRVAEMGPVQAHEHALNHARAHATAVAHNGGPTGPTVNLTVGPGGIQVVAANA